MAHISWLTTRIPERARKLTYPFMTFSRFFILSSHKNQDSRAINCFKGLSGGLTVIELLTIIVIIGILAASIGYKAMSTGETSNIAAIDQVVADIQYVQVLAMGSLAPKSIAFTAGSGTYNMAGETRNLPGSTKAGTTITFTFNSLGEPTAGGDQTVRVGTKDIRVVAITGIVEEL